jgi:hypothetical protein
VSPDNRPLGVLPPPGWRPGDPIEVDPFNTSWIDNFIAWLDERLRKHAQDLEAARVRDNNSQARSLGENEAWVLASRIGQANVGLANEKLGPDAAEYVNQINLASQDLDPYLRLELHLKISAALFATEGGTRPEQVRATLREAARLGREHRQMKADLAEGRFEPWLVAGVVPQLRNPLGGMRSTISGSFDGVYYLGAGTAALRLKDRNARLSHQIGRSLPVDAMDALQIAGGIGALRALQKQFRASRTDERPRFFINRRGEVVDLSPIQNAISDGKYSRFVTNSAGETVDLKPTLDRVARGVAHPHRNDGSTFKNLPDASTGNRGLPVAPYEGYYTEWVVPTPGVSHAGVQRLVTGAKGEIWYSPDHYKTFIRIK